MLKKIIMLALFIFTVFFVHLSVIKGGFLNWDDDIYFTQNIQIRDLSFKSIFSIFSPSISAFSLYHPLTMLSFAVEYKLWGLNPKKSHLVNLLLHLINCVLVFWLIYVLTRSFSVSFFSFLLFSVHPLQVEAVAWISSRKELLFSMFYIAGLIAYFCRSDEGLSGTVKNRLLYIAVFMFFILSILSKVSAVTFPVALVLVDYLKGKEINKHTVADKWPFFIIALIFGIVNMASMYIGHGKHIVDYGLFDRIIISCHIMSIKIIKTVFPYGLSAVYPHPVKAGGFLPAVYYLSLMFLIALVVVIVKTRKIQRDFVFGIMFFVVTLFPATGVIPNNIPSLTFDHHGYLSSAGLFFIAGIVFSRFYNVNFRYKLISTLIFAAIVFVFAFQTRGRIKIWQSDLLLWSDAYSKYPENATVVRKLAEAYANRGDLQKAENYFKKAIKINPYAPELYFNIGCVYHDAGDTERAIAEYTKALKMQPSMTIAYYHRACAYREIKNHMEAIKDLEKAFLLSQDTNMLMEKAMLYLKLKEYDKAISDYERALVFNPVSQETYNNIGYVYYLKGEYKKAAEFFTKAVEVMPNYAEAYFNRMKAFEKLGDYGNMDKDIIILHRLGYDFLANKRGPQK